MCKIVIYSGITDETNKKAWEFIMEMSQEMSGRPESDGIGYAALASDGELFGERWLINRDAFINHKPFSEIDAENITMYQGMIKKDATYNNFGSNKSGIARSVILHSRMATSAKGMINTHPFVIGDTALIHNGVIRNVDELTLKISSCDSEAILNEYIKLDVANNPQMIQKMAHNLEGYYACGILSKTRDNKHILDIFKDQGARLEAYLIKELDAMIFATPGYVSSPVENVCRKLNFTIESTYQVDTGRLLRLDAMTGKPISSVKFDANYNYNVKHRKKKKGHHNTINLGGKEDDPKWHPWGDQYKNPHYEGYSTYEGGKKKDNFNEKVRDMELERKAAEMTKKPDLKVLSGGGGSNSFDDFCDYEEDESGTWHKKGTA